MLIKLKKKYRSSHGGWKCSTFPHEGRRCMDALVNNSCQTCR